jgi:hypothetical protein
LRGKDLIDPDYDPRGPYGLTQAALERRGWHTFEEARVAQEKQRDERHKMTEQIQETKKTAKPKSPQKRKVLAAA